MYKATAAVLPAVAALQLCNTNTHKTDAATAAVDRQADSRRRRRTHNVFIIIIVVVVVIIIIIVITVAV